MTDQPTNHNLEPDDLSNDLTARLIADGVLDPPEIQVAAVASGMVQQILRTAFSMRVEDAESLSRYAQLLLKESKKSNDPQLAEYRQGAKVAAAFLKFRRDLEKLRQ